MGNLRGWEVSCSALDRQGSNFELCVWRAVSSHSYHPFQEVLAQLSLCGGHLLFIFLTAEWISCGEWPWLCPTEHCVFFCWESSRCSPVSMFPDPMFTGICVPQSLRSPVLCSRSLCSPVLSSFSYVPQSLCSPVPDGPWYLCSRYLSFFWGGGGEEGMRSVGTICWQN